MIKDGDYEKANVKFSAEDDGVYMKYTTPDGETSKRKVFKIVSTSNTVESWTYDDNKMNHGANADSAEQFCKKHEEKSLKGDLIFRLKAPFSEVLETLKTYRKKGFIKIQPFLDTRGAWVHF